MFKKFLSLFLAVLMVTGMFPVTALADAQPTQSSMSKGVYLAIYEGTGDFPGEPATHNSAASYVNFTSSFNAVSYNYRDSSAYVTNATGVISSDILNAITEGADGTWGYVKTSGNGVSDYIIDANIKNRENVKKMIRAVDGYENVTEAELENLDILWYVIKKQAGGWFSDDYWHIDGLVVNKTTYYVSYEGNGATGGEVPSGVNKIDPGTTYKIQGIGSLIRKVDGFKSRFVGWCENPDGSTKIYQPGETITVNNNTTFYAIWEDQAVHDVTINVYLDNIKAQVGTVHNNASDLYIKTETGSEYIKLNNTGTGVYTTEVSGNGNYYVYHNHDGEWEQITENFITVYNKDASMDINHYSVAYDLGGGSFASGENNKYNAIYSAGKPVSAASEEPVKTVDGVTYYFDGWRDNNGNVFSAGESVTSAISAPITLFAQWTEPAKAKVNVTIDGNGGGGFDRSDASKEAEFIFRHIHGTATDFPSVSLTPESHNGYTYINNENTHIATYTANNWTYLNLEPSGEYTVYAEKEGYIVTKEVSGSHSEGWVINLGFKYAPEDFTLHYDAVVEDNVPQNIYPEAVNVKVTYWGYDENQVLGWHVISQQLGNGTEKPLYINPVTGEGTSNYPVWKFWADSTEPYYYRVEVVSFVMPDGNTVLATKAPGGVYNSTNGLYSAVVSIENGGRVATYPQSSGVPGAYFDTNSVQNGTPTITISANSFNVTFDANGGLVNGKATDTASNVFAIPDFDNYTATRGDGYTFGGWYTDQSCTVPAEEGKILSGNTTLYAKWKAPLTITGDVTIHGTYLIGENTIEINPVDKPRRATVILRKLGSSGSVANSLIEFDWGTDFGADSATKSYSFTMLPDDGSTYYIDIKVNNYTTSYNNNGDQTYGAGEASAIFAPNSKTATVDAVLDFTPGSYTQKVVVDATDIAKDFRPENSISAEILYRNMGSNTVFDVISQHKTPGGRPLSVTLEENGKGEASEIIWKQFYDGTAYEYQVRIPSTIEGLPCYVTYGNTAHWNGIEASGTLYAYIKANTYDVTFDYNDDNATESKIVSDLHKWSEPTEITEVPTREGYVFSGWECTTAGVSFDSETATIAAEVHEDVILQAKWLTDSNKDNVPDIYQKKVNFFVLNGTWENDSIVPKTVWVTLYDANGDWAEDGTGTLADSDIPTGMEPNPGHGDGKWDRTIVKENITADATYTYSFTLRTDIGYVVHYYKVNTTDSLVPDKTGTGTFGETYTETAPAVSGYNVDAANKNITLSKETGNEITFYYSPRTDLSLTVNYYDYADKGQANPTPIRESRTITNVTFGTTVSVGALAETITGYTYKPEISEYIVEASNNVINLYYEKNSYAYKVEYYYDGVLKNTVNGTAAYGTAVELNSEVKVDFEGNKYALDYTRNNPLTIKEDISANVIGIYYARDEKGGTNDGIPDKYQALVTYSIVGGTWSEEADDNATKSYLFNLRVKDSTGTWVNASPAPTLGTYSGSVDTVPTGMKAITGYNDTTGTWIGAAPAKNTPVTGDAAYTYSYSKREYALNVTVVGGTVKIGNETFTEYHGTYFYDAAGKTVINIEPDAGYTLDSVRVGGVEQNISTLKKANGEAEPINREVPHTAGYNIVVVYKPDTNGDNIPDEYQATVTYKISNGKWANNTDSDIKQIYNLKTLGTNGIWENANPKLQSIPVSNVANEGYNVESGKWDTAIDSNTHVTADVTYFYTYILNKYSVTATVEGGTLTVNGESDPDGSYSSDVTHGSGNTEFKFAPEAKYALDSVTVDGVLLNKTEFEAFKNSSTETFAHTGNHSIKVVYKPDSIGPNGTSDGIPDEYQATVTYKIVNGTWSANAEDNAPKSHVFTIKEMDTDGLWKNVNVTLGDTIPDTNNAEGITGYTQTDGAWMTVIGSTTPVTGDATYVFGFTKTNEYLLAARVTGGTVNGDAKPQNITVSHDANGKTTFSFAPADADYTLDSITVNGVAQDISSWKDTSATSEAVIMADIPHTADYTVEVVYKLDENKDNTPDEYQATVKYEVVNGTWNGKINGATPNSAPKSHVFSLKKLSNDGKSWIDAPKTLGTTIPNTTNAKGNVGYDRSEGRWGTAIDAQTKVTGNVTYFFSFFQNRYTIAADVVGGKVFVGGSGYNDYKTVVPHSAGTTALTFKADEGYTLDSIKVNGIGVSENDFKAGQGSGKKVISVKHDNDCTIEVVYKPDANGDNVPDEYQATVYYEVVNGSWKKDAQWAPDGGSVTITRVHSLKVLAEKEETIGGKTVKVAYWAENPVTLDKDDFPAATANIGYGRGRWNPPAPVNNEVINLIGNMRFTHTFVINEYTTSVTIENGTLRIGESTEITSTPYVFEYPHSSTKTKYNFAPKPGYTLDTVTVDGTTYSGKNITTSEFRDYVDFAHTNNHSVVVVYSIDGNGDEIPDRYQRRVTFDIINGYWNDSTEKPMAPIVKWVTLFDASGNWSETGTGKLPANEIPSGMVPFDYYDDDSGKWDKDLPKDADGNLVDLDVTAAAAYTFKYNTKLQYTVTIEVENGTSFPAPSVSTFDQDGDSTTITFTPDSGFIFESVEVNGAVSTTPITAYTYNHVSNTHIKVVYTKDTVGGGTDGNEGDGIPDKYQQKVVYKIKNGTWNDNSTADKFEWVELYKNGVLAIDGTGTSAVPTGMKAAQHYDVNRGSWTPVIDKNAASVTVQKTADGSEKVYTYDFVRFVYGTTEVPYTVEHYKQNVDGTYSETPSEVVTGKVVLNTTDGKINTEHNGTKVTGTAKEYAHFLAGTSVVPGTSVTPIDLETVEKTLSISSDRLTASFEPIRFYYARDKHTVSYDYNTDVDVEEVFEADKTYNDIICESKVKTEGIPTKRGYIFKGWEDIDSGVVYKAESDITVNKDYRLKAKWERQTGIEYTVNFLEENTGKVLAESIKGTAAFGDTIFASTYYDGKEIAGYTHIGQNKEQLVIDVGSGANVINIYYSKDVVGGGNNYDEGDDIADKYQVTVEYKVSPEENGKVSFEKEVLTIRNADGKPAMRGTVTISGSEVTPNKGWTLLSWNGTDNSAVETVDANGNKNVLAAKEIEVVGGSTYTFTAVLVPETTEVEPSGAVYKVEHYKWNSETGSYELSETEMLMGEIGKSVTALGKDYEGFCVNENAAGHKPSGTVTLPVLEDGEIKDLLVLKLYYDIDVIGEEGEEPDEIPDIYQKKITFRVRNGYWARKAKATNDIYDEIVVYLTLRDENGKLSTEGTAKLVVPTGMTPNRGYGRGRWLKNPPEYVSGTNHEIFTYMFYPLNSGKPQDIVVIPEREETEINPGTGAPILG